tara:strand:- start:3720 stop:4478 length:759 start_codon:yes stop_codon:yes gene_type:complete
LGQAAVRPVRETIYRRALAWALALAANGALIALVLLTPRIVPAPEPLDVIDLVFVTMPLPEVEAEETPPEFAPAPEPEVEVEPEAEPEAAEPETVPDRDDAAVINAPPEDDDDIIEDSSGAGMVSVMPDYGIVELPETAAVTGTPFIIREIFCQTSSDATREAGHCPEGAHPDGLSLLRFATGANADEALQEALAIGLTAEQIRALFEEGGLPLADLSGEPTLADTSTRQTSSSDEMRDSLPPRHPDPAFGD